MAFPSPDALRSAVSDPEDDFFDICRRFDISLPEKNQEVGIYTVDFLWRAERLIVETDRYVYHRGRQAFRDDRERDVDLEVRGFRVLRFDDTRIATTGGDRGGGAGAPR